MSIKTPKIGLVGLGYWGKNIARNLNSLNRLYAICDKDKVLLDQHSKIYPNTKIFNNFKTLLNSEVDTIMIATPAKMHGKMVFESLKNNKNVFVEKPLCLDLSEGYNLKKLANAKGLKLMVGHLLLYHPAFLSVKNLIDNGKIGKLRYIYSNRLSLGKLRKEENALWSFAPHDISMILALVKSEPILVEASGGFYLNKNVADTTITFMHFSQNVKAHVFVSWLHPFKDQRLIVIGEKGMITFIDSNEKEEKLLIYNHEVGWNGEEPIIDKAEGISIPYEMDKEPLNEEIKSFINWLIFDKKPLSDVDEGLRVLKVLHSAEKKLNKL